MAHSVKPKLLFFNSNLFHSIYIQMNYHIPYKLRTIMVDGEIFAINTTSPSRRADDVICRHLVAIPLRKLLLLVFTIDSSHIMTCYCEECDALGVTVSSAPLKKDKQS